jgi:hypothetical protein
VARTLFSIPIGWSIVRLASDTNNTQLLKHGALFYEILSSVWSGLRSQGNSSATNKLIIDTYMELVVLLCVQLKYESLNQQPVSIPTRLLTYIFTYLPACLPADLPVCLLACLQWR